jgi:hypothetical protein
MPPSYEELTGTKASASYEELIVQLMETKAPAKKMSSFV